MRNAILLAVFAIFFNILPNGNWDIMADGYHYTFEWKDEDMWVISDNGCEWVVSEGAVVACPDNKSRIEIAKPLTAHSI